MNTFYTNIAYFLGKRKAAAMCHKKYTRIFIDLLFTTKSTELLEKIMLLLCVIFFGLYFQWRTQQLSVPLLAAPHTDAIVHGANSSSASILWPGRFWEKIYRYVGFLTS